MEDIMDGVQNIVGVQKAKTFFAKVCANVDKTLKKILVQEDVKLDLQRKFEKMILDEHITNLYAPRIIASQVMELKIYDIDYHLILSGMYIEREDLSLIHI